MKFWDGFGCFIFIVVIFVLFFWMPFVARDAREKNFDVVTRGTFISVEGSSIVLDGDRNILMPSDWKIKHMTLTKGRDYVFVRYHTGKYAAIPKEEFQAVEKQK